MKAGTSLSDSEYASLAAVLYEELRESLDEDAWLVDQ
jgi:hypothetical protein